MKRTLAAILCVAACGGKKSEPPPAKGSDTPVVAVGSGSGSGSGSATPVGSTGPMTLAQSGIVPEWVDKTVDPCVDFYAYSCGGFMKTAEIPPDRSSWGAIQIVTKQSEDFLHDVLDKAAKDPGSDPVLTKIGAYYASCMDEAAIEKAGIAPIQPELDAIAKVTDAKTANAAIIALHAEGIYPFFGLSPQQDFADATQEIAGIDQAGLGLPDRKYYLEDKGTMPAVRKTYAEHVERMFVLAGAAPAAAKASADNAIAIEKEIAKLQQDEVARRDPHAVYHRVERAGLEKSTPGFPWGDYLTALGIPSVTAISVHDPKYYPAIAKLIAAQKPAALRDYLTWNVLHSTANFLGKAWVDEAFTMQKALTGQKELPPRWRRCEHRVDGDLGELLAQSYVAAKFRGDSKTRAVDLTKQVLGAMRVEIDALPWMDDTTRVAAKQKLDKMAYLVGFPEKWRAYDFEVGKADFAKNVRAATKFELAREYNKIGKPIDRSEWGMTPPTVNAYYDPSLNQLVLPAGQLQAPFFGETFHPAVNFGSTGGGTIGHEMTHGFDDEGSQFDADGNLRDWWSKSTKDKFAVATKCIVDQYGQYEAVPKIKLDGKLTAGENIADNGGVKLAFQAYQTWKTAQKSPPPATVEGLTDDQLYFLAYGQSWCAKYNPEQLETMAHTNPHSPPMWRVNGVIVNQPGFGPAFKCAAGAPMNPGKTCGVW